MSSSRPTDPTPCPQSVEDLVDRMLSLHKQLDAAKTPVDKTAIQRQIDATDRQIDQLVYELYDLTDYEIKIVEEATTGKIFGEPTHPYTQFLINSLPRFGDKTTRESAPGSPPDLTNLPDGCPFHPRCPQVMEICTQTMPNSVDLETNHKVACWLVGEGNNGKAA